MTLTKYEVGDRLDFYGEAVMVKEVDVRQHGEPDYLVEYEIPPNRTSWAQECELEVIIHGG